MHKQFLLAALEQAWLGRGVCAPNPSVGAVAVRNGKIIAQSWHRGAGTAHAEVLLLDQLGENCSDVTLYVTLEPCNHWGRTAPCVDVIIKRGIKRVIYGYTDPNPVVCANNTPLLLEQHGVVVEQETLPEIDRFYRSYEHWMRTKKPWVTVKIAQTFDGKIAGECGKRVALSNELCSQFTHQERLHSDVILTTARTINQDDPLLNARLNGKHISKPIAVIDANFCLKREAHMLPLAQKCLVYHDEQCDNPPLFDRCTYFPMPATNGRLDLERVIHHLGGLGYHDVWVEAGSALFNALHENHLVNTTYVYLVPKLLGSQAVELYKDVNLFDRASRIHFQPMDDNVIARLDWC